VCYLRQSLGPVVKYDRTSRRATNWPWEPSPHLEDFFQALPDEITARGGAKASDGGPRRAIFCPDPAAQPGQAGFRGQGRYANGKRLAHRAELSGPCATGRDGVVLLARGKLLAACQRSAARPAETVPRWVLLAASWAWSLVSHVISFSSSLV
jgi:hypothetical protein